MKSLIRPWLAIAALVLSLQAQANRAPSASDKPVAKDSKESKGAAKKKRRGGGGLFKDLDLSPEQRAQLKEIREEKKEAMQKSREALKAARETLRKDLESEKSEAALKASFAEVQKLQSEMASDRFSNVLKMRAILTPDQRKKFRGFLEEGRHSRREGDDGQD